MSASAADGSGAAVNSTAPHRRTLRAGGDRVRLAAFGGGLVVLFAAAFGLGALVGDPSAGPSGDTHTTAPASPGHDHEGHRP
ncbi:hypothetical protein [Nocardia sp. alder85J]|uniref:hypothetical protein n=1 Tax=Nocardia sp. alder85J TaxID=2862949 RepID=UPI001CD73904|nr:hypothetical protein [Nocardia sp. alder85J]MCX4097166.1 hypothetical protein [Nocardia sp. alder85J]